MTRAKRLTSEASKRSGINDFQPANQSDTALSRWDRLGAWLSGFCVVHCLLLPVVLILLPAGSLLFDAYHGAHYVFAILLAPLTILVGWEAWQGRRRGMSTILLITGLAALFVALLFHEAQDIVLHTMLTLAGSGLLIAGHLLHLRYMSCAVGSH